MHCELIVERLREADSVISAGVMINGCRIVPRFRYEYTLADIYEVEYIRVYEYTA